MEMEWGFTTEAQGTQGRFFLTTDYTDETDCTDVVCEEWVF